VFWRNRLSPGREEVKKRSRVTAGDTIQRGGGVQGQLRPDYCDQSLDGLQFEWKTEEEKGEVLLGRKRIGGQH